MMTGKKVNTGVWRKSLWLFLLVPTMSCGITVKLDVPRAFAEKATVLAVKGSKSSGLSKKLSFGDYAATDLQRGWAFTSSKWDKMGALSVERWVLQFFGLNQRDFTSTEKNKYSFTLNRNGDAARVYCREQMSTNVTRQKVPLLGQVSTTNGQQYHFAAAILTGSMEAKEKWTLVMKYDEEIQGGSLSMWGQQVPLEMGFLTNESDTIDIKPVVVNKTNAGKKLPLELLGGYELRSGNALVAVVDIIHHDIWLYNDLPDDIKLVTAAAAAAILLRREKSG